MRWRLAVVGLVVAMVATACGGDGDDDATDSESKETTKTSVVDEPVRGGSLTMYAFVEQSSLDPAKVTECISGPSQTGYRLAPIFDTLLNQRQDGSLDYQIATSLESDDGINWTLKIHPDIQFSDGTTYDAAAIKFNWDRYTDPAKAPRLSAVMKGIKSYEVEDATTLQITLASANSQFPRVVARNLGCIGSPKALQENEDGFGTNPVGAGPFLLKSWVPNDQTVLVRNPNYWNDPEPYLDEVTIKIVLDAQQRNNTFKVARGATIMTQSSTAQVLEGQNNNWASSVVQMSGSRGMSYNTTRPPFNDPRARKAVTQALNLDQYNQVVESGIGIPGQAIFSKASPFYDEDTHQPAYDAEAAQELFDAIAADNGGKPLEFTMLGVTPLLPMMEFIQAQLAKYENVKMNLDITAPAVTIQRMQAKEFDVLPGGVTFLDPEPVLFNSFSSRGGNNVTGFKNAELDEALELGRSTLDPKERREAYRTAAKILTEELPVTWLFQRQDTWFLTPDVKGFAQFEDGVPNLEQIWLET